MKRALSLFLFSLVFSEGRASALSVFECVRDLLPVTEVAKIKRRRGLEAPTALGERFLVFLEKSGGHIDGVYLYSVDKSWHFDSLEDVHTGQILPLAEASRNGAIETHRILAQLDGLETVEMHWRPKDELLPLARLKTKHSEPASRQPLDDEYRLREAWIRSHNLESGAFKTFNELLKTSCAKSRRFALAPVQN